MSTTEFVFILFISLEGETSLKLADDVVLGVAVLVVELSELLVQQFAVHFDAVFVASLVVRLALQPDHAVQHWAEALAILLPGELSLALAVPD